MSVKVTVPNTSSDSVVFGSANTPTAAEVVGIDSGSSNGQLAFKTTASGTSTERMRIDASGNVGIGVTPSAWTSVSKALQVSTTTLFSNNLTEIFGANIYRTGGGYTPTYINSTYGGELGFNVNGVGEWTFSNAPSGTSGTTATLTERMRIDSSGNVLVNQTSQTGSAGVFAVANTAGSGGACCVTSTNNNTYYPAIFKNASNSNVGNINCTASATAYATSSDYRLKENIAPMTGALEVVSQLKPVTYTWKADGLEGQGFIAHELQAVVPDCVTGEKDAVDADGNPVYQGIDTSFLVATLTAAIQELKAELDTVKSELATLKGTV